MNSDEPRSEFYYGWPLVAACFFGIAVGISSLYFYSLGVFIKPLAAEYGWSRGEASLGALAGTAGIALMSIPAGRIVDRLGSLPVAITSLCFLAAGFMALGTMVNGLRSFLLLNLLLSALAVGCSPLPFTRLIVAQFHRDRGLALGVSLAGTGIGAMLIPTLLNPFIAEQGWRAAYLLLGWLVALATPVLWITLKRHTRDRGHDQPARPLLELAADPAFRLLGPVFFLAAIAVLGAVVQFVPMLSDWGFDPVVAGSVAALIGAAAIVGRLSAGFLLDRAPAHWVTSGLMAAASIGLLLLSVGGVAFAVPGALIIGLAVGAEVDLISFLASKHFKAIDFGQAYGAIYASFFIGGAIGPALSGYLRDSSGDYSVSLMISATLLLVAAALASRIGRLPVIVAPTLMNRESKIASSSSSS